MTIQLLPPDIVVFERGWLSSNNVLLLGEGPSVLVDSGYASHAEQTLHLVRAALAGKTLTTLVNTHLHSDHCGGNGHLQAAFPDLVTCIPPGQAHSVRDWDPVRLSYVPTGQTCPRFDFNRLLVPGEFLRLGPRDWQVLAAPGHDPHSIILFQPDLRLLISADALWENGFGVVFPELEGDAAFDQVAQTLDLIESLDPLGVIPGHGSPFAEVSQALDCARKRLAYFTADPLRHARYASKVLIKFKLLELQRVSLPELQLWVRQTSYFGLLHATHFSHLPFEQWTESVMQELIASGSARQARQRGVEYLINV